MKAISVSELKNHLSKYLRLASRGERIVVKNRTEVVAELHPATKRARTPLEQMADEGLVRLGKGSPAKVAFSKLKARAGDHSVLEDLEWVRGGGDDE